MPAASVQISQQLQMPRRAEAPPAELPALQTPSRVGGRLAVAVVAGSPNFGQAGAPREGVLWVFRLLQKPLPAAHHCQLSWNSALFLPLLTSHPVWLPD